MLDMIKGNQRLVMIRKEDGINPEQFKRLLDKWEGEGW